MLSSPAQPGPVRLTRHSRATFWPASRAAISSGFWAERRRVNREVTVPSAWDHLHEAGNFRNLELAAGVGTGEYSSDLWFLDSDVYKWLEAVGWTLADPELSAEAAARLEEQVDVSWKLLAQAQAEDGYLDSYYQVRYPGTRFEDLQWGHELYCAGHLMQAAIAVHRTSGDSRLLEVTRRMADLVVRSFGGGEGQIDGVDGHPEIESALVELYRETEERSYLDAATYFVDRRGHGLLGPGRFGAHYFQDHVPVRDAASVEGHAVRQLYLLAGLADVYIDMGDESLRQAAERLWQEMVSTKTYITGGIGTHHSDEAFGDPYELTNERSYCETCAAIASVMFSWRMLLVTGEARYADLIERTLYNGFLSGLSLDGQRYIYANPLQVREGHLSGGTDQDYARKPWFKCACCPPNVMRTLASLEHYVLISSADEVRLHQYISGRYSGSVGEGETTLEVETDYPWNGRVRVVVVSVPKGRWSLVLRVPHWADYPSVRVNGEQLPGAVVDGWLPIERDWKPNDEVVLDLPLEPRFTRADPRVDADRGLVALERGPLVYCIEAVDHPGQRLDDLVIDPHSAPELAGSVGQLGPVPTLRLGATRRSRSQDSWWPYTAVSSSPESSAGSTTLTAVPYYAWGNRGEGPMRVWLRAE